MPGVRRLHRLTLAAVGSAPHLPMVLVADGVAAVPEGGGHPGIGGVLELFGLLPAFHEPGYLRGELESTLPCEIDKKNDCYNTVNHK